MSKITEVPEQDDEEVVEGFINVESNKVEPA